MQSNHGATVAPVNGNLAIMAHNRQQRMIALAQSITAAAVELGQHFEWFARTEAYRELGYESMREFLAQPDLSFSYKTFYNLKRVYTTYCLTHEADIGDVAAVPYSKLIAAIPLLETKPVEEVIAIADTNSRRDVNRHVLEAKGQTVRDFRQTPADPFNGIMYGTPYPNTCCPRCAELERENEQLRSRLSQLDKSVIVNS